MTIVNGVARIMLTVVLALLLSTSAHALPPAPDDVDAQAFKEALLRMSDARSKLVEYEHDFYSREWVNGAMTDLDVVKVRYRAPWEISMRWVEGPHAGRVLLYRGPDWNKGRFRINPGRLLPVISLHPDSSLARRGTRHTIYDLPLPSLIDKFVTDATLVNDHPSFKPDVVDEGPTTVRGEPSHCFVSNLPKGDEPTLYAHRVRICIHPDTGLPNALRVWDVENGALRLVEEYDYVGFRLRPGFDELTFHPTTYGL